jgi:hypothetical protein
MASGSRHPIIDDTPPLGGWLLLLCLLLVVWQPANLGLTAAGALAALAIRGLPLALLLLLRVVAAAFGIAAGIALFRRQTAAVRMAKVSLVVAAVTDLVVYATPYFPNNRMPGDTAPIAVAATLFYAGWFTYLVRSRRVRETFG